MKVVRDDTQLKATNDVVKCRRCGHSYKVTVYLDLKKNSTCCPKCERVQVYVPLDSARGDKR